MNDDFSTGFAAGAGVMLIVVVVFAGGLFFILPWLRTFLSTGRVSLVYVIGMRLRGTPVALVTDAFASLVQRGERVTLREVESQYIAHRDSILERNDLIERVTEYLRRKDKAHEKRIEETKVSQGSSLPDQSSNAATKGSIEVPFGLDRKPLPSGEDLEQLLPPHVGGFQRGEIRVHNNDIHTGPIYAEYTDSSGRIWMELGICGNPANAQRAIETVKAEAADVTTATEACSIGTDPSFLKIQTNNPRLGGKGVGISWTRGEYFFTAGTREEESLGKFMRLFPY